MQRLFQFLFTLFLLMIPCLCKGQITPPKQVDEYSVERVTYSVSVLEREYWPCETIYKSATSFRFGESEYAIVNEWNGDVVSCFSVQDVKSREKENYKLEFKKLNGKVLIEFSGYTFVCTLKKI